MLLFGAFLYGTSVYEHTGKPPQLRLAVAPGVPTHRLSALLQLQRAEEPEVSLAIYEVSNDLLLDGLREFRYDVGMSLHGTREPSLRTQPLWKECIAAALPLGSPLLDHATSAIADLQAYPIYRWQAEVCSLLDHRLESAITIYPEKVQWVTSFESMSLWVAAGYGIGLSAQSRIEHAQGWGIAMRPLADGPYEIGTYLQRPLIKSAAISERFEHRAMCIARTMPCPP